MRRRRSSGAGASPRHWHRRLRHSLHWRLVAMFVLLALATTLILVGGTRAVLGVGWRELVQPLFADYVDRLAAEVGNPPDVGRAQALVQRLPIAVRIEGPRINWSSHERPSDRGEDSVNNQSLLSRQTADGHVVRFGLGDWHAQRKPPGVVWIPLVSMLVLLVLAFAFVRRLFRPLDDIRAGALRYGAGDFSQPIPLRRHDELGELAAQVNTMASGLQHLLEGQRALLLAISHELRSPLTRARLNAELVAEGTARDALLRDLALMRDLVTDLLESERLAGGHGALQREPCQLGDLIDEVLGLHFAGQPIVLVVPDAVPTLPLDRSRMQMLLRNLLDNALRHNAGVADPVTVSLRTMDGRVCLAIRDHGPGVPEAELDRLAQPFYRPDAARTRSGGGVGLGLYLCRLVAQSHGGSLHFRNAEPGLEVSLELPLG